MNSKTGVVPSVLKKAFMIFFFMSLSFMLWAQTSEYTVKAVAFEKISLFTQWPSKTFENSDSDFIIAVLGENTFGKELENIYADHKIKDKKVRIVYLNDIKQLTNCNLLFISKISKSKLPKILSHIGKKPILTIADSEGFAEAGCFINFFEQEGKIRFEINQKALEAAGFKVDYKLLQVSKIVKTQDK